MNRENILLKKEIGECDDRQCHIFCDFNFYEFRKKTVPLHRPTATYTQLAYIYVHTTADDFPQSL
jgi:hypothetical protein